MKNYKFTINGNSYDTSIINVEDNIAEIEINGTIYKVEVDKQMKAQKTPKLVRPVAIPSTDAHPSVAKTSSPSTPKGAGNIKSPLPGVILDVFVREGDTVSMGQKLLLLEAMKMENNIEADKAGKVISINKRKGDAVMEGDILIVIGE
ncbi:MAG: acetyl-CoA carboxylase biotin carboxyl carrier protein subunit [Bacteroidia bacterium]|nr:acetyl-CoA carboxylase biotin carboxyl carrier protein subunit [Bacteroidia bacterium]